MNMSPAVTLLTISDAPPPPICASMYALIALCVGTTLSLFAVKNGSVLNSVTLAELPPSVTSPSDSSCNPAILNAFYLREGTRHTLCRATPQGASLHDQS